MNLNVIYTIEDELIIIDYNRIKTFINSGEAKYKYAFPDDKDYLYELQEEAPTAKTIIVFKIGDAKIPPTYNFKIIDSIIKQRLEDITNPQEDYREVEGITIAEIDLTEPSV